MTKGSNTPLFLMDLEQEGATEYWWLDLPDFKQSVNYISGQALLDIVKNVVDYASLLPSYSDNVTDEKERAAIYVLGKNPEIAEWLLEFKPFNPVKMVTENAIIEAPEEIAENHDPAVAQEAAENYVPDENTEPENGEEFDPEADDEEDSSEEADEKAEQDAAQD